MKKKVFDEIILHLKNYDAFSPENMKINENIAKKYGIDRKCLTYGTTPYDTFAKVIEETAIKQVKRFYCIGSSIGWMCFYANKIFGEIEIIGIDIHSPRIEYANKIKEKYNLNNITFHCADALSFNYKESELCWMSNACFPYEFGVSIYEKILPTTEVCISYISPYSSSLPESKITRKEIACETSWNKSSSFYILKKKQVPTPIPNKKKNSNKILTINDTSLNNVYEEYPFLKEWQPKFNCDSIDEGLHLDFLDGGYDVLRISRVNKDLGCLRLLSDKNKAKEIFSNVGLKTPGKILYSDTNITAEHLKKSLGDRSSFVIKPCHMSDSDQLIIVKDNICLNSKSPVNYAEITDKLNTFLTLTARDSPGQSQSLINAKKGILVEEYIDRVNELKVFCLWGSILFGDLRKTASEFTRIELIPLKNTFFDWSDVYTKIELILQEIKLDFIRVDFIYDGNDLYANEFEVMPGSVLPQNIGKFIATQWVKGYQK